MWSAGVRTTAAIGSEGEPEPRTHRPRQTTAEPVLTASGATMAAMPRSYPKTAADERFEAYLVDHGIPYQYEPPWEERLGVSAEVLPDFLIEPAGARVVAEVKQFETTHITDRLTRGGGVATLSDRAVYRHLRGAMTKTAREQLLPFAGAGVPLVVVLANPLGADVNMDFDHVAFAALGNMKVRVRIRQDGLPDDQHEPAELVADGYGAFISVTEQGLVNHHPHVSAVVVVHERQHRQDWVQQVIAEEPDVDELGGTGPAMDHYLKTVARREAEQGTPEGSYRWVEVYDLSGNPTPPGFNGVPLPRAVFSGERDRWYGFTEDGFGEID
jgi:hypothetical protein